MLLKINDVDSLLILEGLRHIQRMRHPADLDYKLSERLQKRIYELVEEEKRGKDEVHNDIQQRD